MLANREKAELIAEISGRRTDPTVQLMLKLIESLIQETREENDTAPPDRFVRNQGKIAGYVDLREYILRGIPAGQNISLDKGFK
jgi:hypothetical protein